MTKTTFLDTILSRDLWRVVSLVLGVIIVICVIVWIENRRDAYWIVPCLHSHTESHTGTRYNYTTNMPETYTDYDDVCDLYGQPVCHVPKYTSVPECKPYRR